MAGSCGSERGGCGGENRDGESGCARDCAAGRNPGYQGLQVQPGPGFCKRSWCRGSRAYNRVGCILEPEQVVVARWLVVFHNVVFMKSQE